MRYAPRLTRTKPADILWPGRHPLARNGAGRVDTFPCPNLTKGTGLARMMLAQCIRGTHHG